MSNTQLIKKSGWAFIASAFAFITILGNSDAIQIPGSVVSAILLAVGLSGLRAGYGEKAGGFSRHILRFGVIATVLFCVGLAVLASLYISKILPESQIEEQIEQIEEGAWILLFGGPALGLLSLTLFGLSMLLRKPVASLNWLPLFAGIWYPVAYLVFTGYLFTHHGVYQWDTTIQITRIIVWIQFFALCTLGTVLASDKSREMATA